ncbi:MAG TPA: glycosyltransferase, partial [bacterium]|nr:glycosyltransferase [bacterium]
MKIVLIGGHHSSAIPVIKELQKSDSSLELVWFGHRNSTRSNKRESLEHKEITALGLKFYSLRAGKFYRTYNPISLLMIPLGFVHALLLLIKERPDAILTFGGYLSVPVVTVGWFLRIPSVLHEQTVVVGYANKFSSFFAKRVLLSWPDSIKFFNKKKVQVVGIPIRSEIFEASSASFICEPSLPVMYITAGKSGSNKINLLINSILEHLLDEVNIIHQCGDHSQFNDYDKLLNTYNN